MKNKVISIASAIIIISACILTSCTKTEKIAPESLPVSSPKVDSSFTLKWNNGNTTYKCQSVWGSYVYSLYKNGSLISVTTINDTSSTHINADEQSVQIVYDEFSVNNLEFFITDLAVVDDTTVTFTYRMGENILVEFTMNACNAALEDIIDDFDEEPAPADSKLSPTGPHFRVFPDGTAKVILDLSTDAINAASVNPLYDDAAYCCYRAMNQHINGDHGGSPVIHTKNHLFPSHIGCVLLCNGTPVNFH